MQPAARNGLKVFFYGTLLLAAVILVMSFYPQFIQGYELKREMKLACNDFIKLKRFNSAPEDPSEKFIRKTAPFGVKLQRDENFAFKVEPNAAARSHVCTARTEYIVTIKWFLLDTVARDIPPYKFKKVIRVTHEVPDKM